MVIVVMNERPLGWCRLVLGNGCSLFGFKRSYLAFSGEFAVGREIDGVIPLAPLTFRRYSSSPWNREER